MLRKISSPVLFRKFPSRVIKHFILSTVLTVVRNIVDKIIFNILQLTGTINSFNQLLPAWLPVWGHGQMSQAKFVLYGLLLVLLLALIYYFDNLIEGELQIKGERYSKSVLLEKFRHLSLQDRTNQAKQVVNLVEDDAETIGEYWEHLFNHSYHSVLEIITIIFFNQKELFSLSVGQDIFYFFWLALSFVVASVFSRVIFRNQRIYKKKLTTEWALRNKEINKSVLIDSMGLTPQFRSQHAKITRRNEKLLLRFNRTKSLSSSLSYKLLMNAFPFLLLLLGSSGSFKGLVLMIFWRVLQSLNGILYCWRDYTTDYASSQERINNFLALPEKNDNLAGYQLTPQQVIRSIEFRQVDFRYREQESWVLANYNRTFASGKINYLRGKNGTGKSTILYLLLGMLTPHNGQVIITTNEDHSYNLHAELNLRFWREHKMAYCSHDNLIEKGSTGQKQLANITNLFQHKQSALVWLFDEADNALDQDNQQKLTSQLEELVSQGKIVIYIKH